MTCTLRIINLNRDRGFTTMEFAPPPQKKRKKKINKLICMIITIHKWECSVRSRRPQTSTYNPDTYHSR